MSINSGFLTVLNSYLFQNKKIKRYIITIRVYGHSINFHGVHKLFLPFNFLLIPSNFLTSD